MHFTYVTGFGEGRYSILTTVRVPPMVGYCCYLVFFFVTITNGILLFSKLTLAVPNRVSLLKTGQRFGIYSTSY